MRIQLALNFILKKANFNIHIYIAILKLRI